ncbi:MAG: acetylxylan esterase [Spirochaetota bacterium]
MTVGNHGVIVLALSFASILYPQGRVLFTCNFEAGLGECRTQGDVSVVESSGGKYAQCTLTENKGVSRITLPAIALTDSTEVEVRVKYRTACNGAQHFGPWIYIAVTDGTKAINEPFILCSKTDEWKDGVVRFSCPDNARVLNVQLRLQGAQGRVDWDDITVLSIGAGRAAAIKNDGASFAAVDPRSIWEKPLLREVPAVFPVEGMDVPGLRSLFFEGVPYRGKPTRVFAWYGVPKIGGPKFPAMVLVTGGGGTAYAKWVRIWNDRGYAAIAMDTYGGIPFTNKDGSQPHSWAGPVGALDTFEQIDEPIEDQWPYHGVAAVLRAHSLIRSFPEIDTNRIGITGISWGGYLTSMASGIDGRFACAAPVYGCGYFLLDSGGMFDKLKSMGERGKKWTALWDASTVLKNARLPMLWLTGSTDRWFPIPSWQHSYRTAPGTRSIAMRAAWPHNQEVGANAPEIGRFMDSILTGTDAMPRIIEQKIEKDVLTVTYESPRPIVEAELNYTSDSGTSEKRAWNTVYIPFDAEGKKVTVPVPPSATFYFCNIADRDGVIASSECMEHTATAAAAAMNGTVILNEDFENRGVGITPKGVSQDRAKGATIEITDEVSASGTRSLRFTDAPGLAYAYHPVREFYLGSSTMTKGLVTLAFNFRNSKAKPGHMVIEMRDMRKSPHQRGPRLEFTANGKLSVGGKETALPFDSWTRIEMTMILDGSGGRTHTLKITGENVVSEMSAIPCSPEFGAISWLAFMMPSETNGVIYLDDILFSCQ